MVLFPKRYPKITSPCFPFFYIKSPPPSTVDKDTYPSTGIDDDITRTDYAFIPSVYLPDQQPEKELKPSAYYSQDLIISMPLL